MKRLTIAREHERGNDPQLARDSPFIKVSEPFTHHRLFVFTPQNPPIPLCSNVTLKVMTIDVEVWVPR